jgi:preprotein translocase subunit SecF
LPVLAVLVVGADILGATTLQSYGLALFVGLMSGAYSSIFIASPLLAIMKEREPRYRDLAARVLARGDRRVLTATSAAVAGAQATSSSVGVRPMRSSSVTGTIQARARKQKRR